MLRRSHKNIDAVWNVSQLCPVPCNSRAHERSSRLGAARAAEKANNAKLSEAPWAPVVQEGKGCVKEISREV